MPPLSEEKETSGHTPAMRQRGRSTISSTCPVTCGRSTRSLHAELRILPPTTAPSQRRSQCDPASGKRPQGPRTRSSTWTTEATPPRAVQAIPRRAKCGRCSFAAARRTTPVPRSALSEARPRSPRIARMPATRKNAIPVRKLRTESSEDASEDGSGAVAEAGGGSDMGLMGCETAGTA